MKTRRTLSLLALLTAGISLPGCQVPGAADPEPPDVSGLLGEDFENDSPQTDALPELASADRWWTGFGDAAIDELVEFALAGNLDLRESAARVMAAEARLRSVSGARQPSLDASFGASRSYSATELGRSYSTDLEPALRISWQADLFGKLRSRERGRAAELFASENDRVSLVHSLAAQVVRQRVNLSVARRRLGLLDDIVESRAGTLEIVERRYSTGVEGTSAVDVRLARENLAAAEANVGPFELDIETTLYTLDELLGRKPGTTAIDTAPITPLPELSAPPLGVPVALLDQRPDLRGAAFRVRAAAADVDVALAELYPDLVISGALGWRGEEFSELFSADRLFASLAGDLAVRLFAGGQLEAEVDVARAELEAQGARYGARVLAALREVEEALVRERRLGEQLEKVRQQRSEARIAETLARERYSRGLESLLFVLETERRRANADDLGLDLEGRLWSARIDLHLALGGDWFASAAPPTDESAMHTAEATGPTQDQAPTSQRRAGGPTR